MKRALLLSLRASAPFNRTPRYPCFDKLSTLQRMSSTSSSEGSNAVIPRAAVAVTVQALQDGKEAQYLLIKRKNPPAAGQWSLPGGKIELGEETLTAGQRELTEETNLSSIDCLWYQYPFMTTDAIYENGNGDYSFHYLIAHCFAQTKSRSQLPMVTASDDALDAKWWTVVEIEEQLLPSNAVSKMVLNVINRAESLYAKDNLLPRIK
jgi:8-oxo-dGTP diphosphatase